jgi:hypothetical protein
MRSQRPGSGSDFLFSDHRIGPKKGQAEINERGGSLATHAGGDFTGESGESVVQVDLGNTLAHEGCELEKEQRREEGRGRRGQDERIVCSGVHQRGRSGKGERWGDR